MKLCPHGLRVNHACIRCKQAKRMSPLPVIPDQDRGEKVQRINFLERRRKAVIADMMIKVEGEDWHGVADAAMDLRDTDNELDGLRF